MLRQVSLENPNSDASPIFAYEGLSVKDTWLQSLLTSTLTKETGDFSLVKLVRTLYFAQSHSQQVISAQMEDRLLQQLADLHYWQEYDEGLYCYWSENHLIMWMSSAYLMRQLKGWQMDPALDDRLHHYLDLKIKYGFYEFFSTTYLPYTLSGLLNLVDFAEDEAIRMKAEKAASILMKTWLMVVNDQGSFFPAAGRNYLSKYKGTSYHPLTYALTGLGRQPTGPSHITGFLATTSMSLEEAASTWRNELDVSYSFGHSMSDSSIHKGLNRQDRTFFQWSAGGYFHPSVANDTTYTVDFYNLEKSKHFSVFKNIPNFPDSWANGFAKIGASFSRGSAISEATIDIFKNQGVVLTSIDNYYGGYAGYQQRPWAATVDDISVWTQAGEISSQWNKYSSLMQNTHLPSITQKGHVALITYNPNKEIKVADGIKQIDTDVALHWPAERFDETTSHGLWVIGRKGSSYIAVLRDADTVKDGILYSGADRGRQMWAVVVGNEKMHQSFSRFQEVVKAATYKEEYIWSFYEWNFVYKTNIDIDGVTISKRW